MDADDHEAEQAEHPNACAHPELATVSRPNPARNNATVTRPDNPCFPAARKTPSAGTPASFSRPGSKRPLSTRENSGESNGNRMTAPPRTATLAASDLERDLRADTQPDERHGTEDTRRDLAVAAAIKAALIDDDVRFARRARDILTRMGDGLGVSLLDSAIAWQSARAAADPLANLRAADPTFAAEDLADYIARRGIEVLFPSQITVIQAGLTTDQQLTVSLRTSSRKTFLAEFKIAATLQRHPDATVIYVAPYRLLSRQVTRSFERTTNEIRQLIADNKGHPGLTTPGGPGGG
jgi:hypothetical protein